MEHSAKVPMPTARENVQHLHENGIGVCLDDFLKAMRDDKIENYVIVYTEKYDKPDEEDGAERAINFRWTGENSSLAVLGLLEYVKDQVLAWMNQF